DQYDQAIEKYNQALELMPQSQHPFVLCLRSAAFTVIGAHEMSLNDAEEAIRINKSFAQAYFRKGLALSLLGRFQECVDTLDEGIQLSPKNSLMKELRNDILDIMNGHLTNVYMSNGDEDVNEGEQTAL